MISLNCRPGDVQPNGWRHTLAACTRTFGRGLLTVLFSGATLFAAAPVSAATSLDIKVITWDVIGLDSNKPSTDGPVDFPLAVRVKNTGGEAALNVVVTPTLLAGNPHVTIVGAQQITTPSLAINQVADFYFHVTIARPPANNSPGYFSIIGNAATVKPYYVEASATNAPTVNTNTSSPNRQLFVEKILSQNRNSVAPILEVDFPDVPFIAGQIRTFTLFSTTATGYDQEETTINFPTDLFQILSVKAVYDEPNCGCISNPKPLDLVEPLVATAGKFTTNKVYVDGCGWVTNSLAAGYMTSNNSCSATTADNESPTGKIGGNIVTTYKVRVLETVDREVGLDYLVHDHSGSSFHYNFDDDVFMISPTNIAVEKSALDDPVEAGENFSYMITVCNTSLVKADDVVLTDSLPACATFVSADPAPVNAAADPLRWELGTLDPMECVDIEIVATASCDTGECENIATVSTSDFETNYNDNEDDAVINIVDTVLPDIDCPPDQDIDCGDSTDPADTGEATAEDDCGIASIVPSDVSMPLCGDTEVTTRTWTATDNNGNISTCTQIITSFDTDPPVLSADPADATAECDDVPDAATLTATDDCEGNVPVVFEETRTDGACPDAYTLNRKWTATDDCGNSAEVTQVVTVVDTTDPVISGDPANVTAECDDVPAAATLTATDNCDDSVPVVFEETRTDGACPDAYTLNRKWTATDDCGNSAEVTQVVTVVDTTDPVLSGDPANVTAECDDVPAAATLTATDNCDDSVPVVFEETRTNGTCADSYTLNRKWTATDDCGNSAEVTQTVTVSDTTDPELSGDPADVTAECDDVPDAATLTATDNCDDNVPVVFEETRTDGNCPDSYTLNRKWTATDDCGNSAEVTQVVTVVDTTPPALTCPDDISVPGPTGAETCVVVTYSATATDNCDDDVDISFDPPSGTCFDCGTVTEVEVTATDDCGNETSCTFTVTVGDCVRDGCSLTQGYWKNHPEDWPIQSMMLGNRSYTKAECLQILNTPVQRNGLIALAHQLIAAKLNVASSAPNACIAAIIIEADALIGNKVVPPIGNGNIPTKQASDLNNKLDDYNNGRMCSPHCDDVEPNPVTFQL